MSASHYQWPGALLTGILAAVVLAACSTARSLPTESARLAPGGSASVQGTAGNAPSNTQEPSAPSSESVLPEPSGGGPYVCGPSISLPATTERATISDVRVGTHDGYDRVVFEFDSGLPLITIEAALPPLYQDASGLPVVIPGTAFLKITMTAASVASVDGAVVYEGPYNFAPTYPRLAAVVQAGDFEAVATWYIGLTEGSCLNVFTMDSPSRLVIDIEQ